MQTSTLVFYLSKLDDESTTPPRNSTTKHLRPPRSPRKAFLRSNAIQKANDACEAPLTISVTSDHTPVKVWKYFQCSLEGGLKFRRSGGDNSEFRTFPWHGGDDFAEVLCTSNHSVCPLTYTHIAIRLTCNCVHRHMHACQHDTCSTYASSMHYINFYRSCERYNTS